MLLLLAESDCHDRAVTYRAEPGTDSALAARLAAIASIGAAVIHVAVTPSHWQAWLPAGLFFASVAVFQVIWASAAWVRPGGPLLAAGLLVNGGCVALWVWSRTTGVPFGPHAGEPEAVAAADICALLLQCYAVMGAAWAWLRIYRQESVSRVGSALVMLGGNAVIGTAVVAGVASSLLSPDHHTAPADAAGPAVPAHVTPAIKQAVAPAVAPAEPGHHSGDAHHHDQ
ncbi:MAG: hypothetical protein FGM52_11845 [Mycobacterium sp.]|nr:hypothetical protein [Mycobacterium sp.]